MMYLLILVINQLFGVFTEGTFPIRPFLFATYLLILAATLYILSRTKLSRDVRSTPTKFLVPVTIGALSLLFGINLFLQIYTYLMHGIPLDSPAFFIHAHQITSTFLTHIHFGKSALALPLVYLAPHIAGDTGAGILLAVRVPIALFETVLISVATIASVLLAYWLLPTTSATKKLLWVLCYGLVAFVSLEKSVDGGLLSDTACMAFGIYIVLLTQPARRFLKVVAIVILADVVLMLFLVDFPATQVSAGTVIATFEQAGVLVLLVSSLHTYVYGTRPRIACACTGVALLALGLVAYSPVQRVITYYFTPLMPSTDLVAVMGTSNPAFYSQQPTLTVGAYRTYAPVLSLGRTVGSFVQATHLPMWYFPITTMQEVCATAGETLQMQYSLSTQEPLSTTTIDRTGYVHLTVTADSTARDAAGWYHWHVTSSVNQCLPEYLQLIEGEVAILTQSKDAIVYGIQIQ